MREALEAALTEPKSNFAHLAQQPKSVPAPEAHLLLTEAIHRIGPYVVLALLLNDADTESVDARNLAGIATEPIT